MPGGILDFSTQSEAYTYNTTTTYKDAFNQSSTSTNALENVGSLNVTLPPANALASAAPLILAGGVVLLAVALMKRM
jgi:hypothetical protein